MLVSKLPSDNLRAGPSDFVVFPKGFMAPFLLVTSLFALWSVVNNLNDILIRQFISRSPSPGCRLAWCNRHLLGLLPPCFALCLSDAAAA